MVRESSVALCHRVPPPRSFACAIFLHGTETIDTQAIMDQESSVALCHRVVLKKRIGSQTERAVLLSATGWRLKETDQSSRVVLLCATGWR